MRIIYNVKNHHEIRLKFREASLHLMQYLMHLNHQVWQ